MNSTYLLRDKLMDIFVFARIKLLFCELDDKNKLNYLSQVDSFILIWMIIKLVYFTFMWS
ncbi:hypothetical protein DsansV1_C08g0086401 [Dioscorea sansibarensis]